MAGEGEKDVGRAVVERRHREDHRLLGVVENLVQVHHRLRRTLQAHLHALVRSENSYVAYHVLAQNAT